nr:hypothetical protein [Tanacetum cinerariifolium]
SGFDQKARIVPRLRNFDKFELHVYLFLKILLPDPALILVFILVLDLPEGRYTDGLAEVHNYENCYDNEIFNMFTQEEHYTALLEPIPEPHQVPQNDNNVISEVSSMEQSGGTVEQHPANVKETRALYDSLYNNLAIEVEKVNTVNRKLSETNAELTTELA